MEGEAKTLPVAGDVIRVVTANGWAYPFTIVSSEQASSRVRVRVVETPALRYDREGNKLSLRSFPQREHTGPVYVDWLR